MVGEISCNAPLPQQGAASSTKMNGTGLVVW